MLKFRVDNKELKVFKDTKFRVEWNHPVFSDDVIPASIIYPFEIPPRANEDIFGALYLRDEERTNRVFDAEVLWLDGSWMRGKLVMQKVSRWRYSAGFVFSIFEDGFGDRKVSEFLPTIDFLGNATTGLYEFADYDQGDIFNYLGQDFKVDVQCPLMWAKAGNEDFQLRNLIDPVIGTMWRNYVDDYLGIFNKKLISPALYLKSIIEYIFPDWTIRGSWFDDPVISDVLLLNNKAVYAAQGKYTLDMQGHYEFFYLRPSPPAPQDVTVHKFIASTVSDADSISELNPTTGYLNYVVPVDGDYQFEVRYDIGIYGEAIFNVFKNDDTVNPLVPLEEVSYNGYNKNIVSAVTGDKLRIDAGFIGTISYIFNASITVSGVDASVMKYPPEVINYSDLVPENLTVSDFLRKTLNALGGLFFIDKDRKIIELNREAEVRNGSVLDLSPNMAESFAELREVIKRQYLFDNKTTVISNSPDDLKKNQSVPLKSGKRFRDTSSHSYYESNLQEGLLIWQRQGTENDTVEVGTVDNKEERKSDVSYAENFYVSDLFTRFEPNVKYNLGEYVIADNKLYVSNTEDNADSPLTVPLPVTWSFITDETILANSADTNDITLTVWRGKNNSRQMVGTSTKLNKDGDTVAPDFDLRMSGEDAVFSNYLVYLDKWRYSDTEVFQLDANVDLDKVKEMFAASATGEDFVRRFRVGNIIYVPRQFNCVLSNDGIQQAQIKGVEV